MIHVEGKILDEDLTFDVKSPERCNQVIKALHFFKPLVVISDDSDENKSSCLKECPGCPVKTEEINE